MSKRWLLGRKELIAKVLDLERRVEELRDKNPGSGVIRLSCPPYEILILDQRVE